MATHEAITDKKSECFEKSNEYKVAGELTASINDWLTGLYKKQADGYALPDDVTLIRDDKYDPIVLQAPVDDAGSVVEAHGRGFFMALVGYDFGPEEKNEVVALIEKRDSNNEVQQHVSVMGNGRIYDKPASYEDARSAVYTEEGLKGVTLVVEQLMQLVQVDLPAEC